MKMACVKEAHQDFLGMGAARGAVPSPAHLPIDDGRTKGLFRGPVGGFQPGMLQEGEQSLPVSDQMAGEGLVGRIADGAGKQTIRPGFEMSSGQAHAAEGDRPRTEPIS